MSIGVRIQVREPPSDRTGSWLAQRGSAWTRNTLIACWISRQSAKAQKFTLRGGAEALLFGHLFRAGALQIDIAQFVFTQMLDHPSCAKLLTNLPFRKRSKSRSNSE